MLNFDPAKLAALRMALANSPASPQFSTGKTVPESTATIRNIPRASRKEPAEFKAKTETHGEKAKRKAAQRDNLEALAKRPPKIQPVPEKASPAASQTATKPLTATTLEQPQYESLQTARRKAKAAADEMLRRAAIQEAKQTTPEHTDILRQIAGYDPNEVQGDNDVVFRPKGGGRPDKTGRRHTVLHRVEHLEQMQGTFYGRERIAETQDAIADGIREIVSKTGIDFDIHYVHRPVQESQPQLSSRDEHNLQFPHAPITDDDVREAVGLLTSTELAIQEIETTMARKSHGMEVSSDIDDNDAPTKCEVIVYDTDNREYKLQQAASEFALAFAIG